MKQTRQIAYSALIRTFNSEKTLPRTLESLARQSHPPSKFVFVNSGSTDQTLTLLPSSSILQTYIGEMFNFSDALNQGIALVDTKYTLIISSHTSIVNDAAIEFCIDVMERNEDIAASYFIQHLSDQFEISRIDRNNFTGFNGTWNTCALIKTSFLKKRPFRHEVFSAEDQEWSKWLLEVEGKSIARISGAGMSYNNPVKYRFKKRMREELAVALYVKNEMLHYRYLARVSYRVLRPISATSERVFSLCLLLNLLYCKFFRSNAEKYFGGDAGSRQLQALSHAIGRV